jgi:hypothetical protein
MVSETNPQIDGHGAPPNVILKAINNMPAKIVRLSEGCFT